MGVKKKKKGGWEGLGGDSRGSPERGDERGVELLCELFLTLIKVLRVA